MSGDAPHDVFAELRHGGGAVPARWSVPARPAASPEAAAVTIADLGDFDATTYAALLDRWSRAAVAAWGAPPPAAP